MAVQFKIILFLLQVVARISSLLHVNSEVAECLLVGKLCNINAHRTVEGCFSRHLFFLKFS